MGAGDGDGEGVSSRHMDELPTSPSCTTCGAILTEPFGWCSGCRAAYCFPCGRRHFCTPQCPGNGCQAGLCVREVRDGTLSASWGLPPEG